MDLLTDDSPQLAARYDQRGTALLEAFERTGHPAQLLEWAVQDFREAVGSEGGPAIDIPIRKQNLGIGLRALFRNARQQDDFDESVARTLIDEAVKWCQEAEELGRGGADHAVLMANLGVCRMRRVRTHRPSTEVREMRDAATILMAIRERGRGGKPLERVYRLLFNREVYLLACSRISRNAGATTPGPDRDTVDGMSLAKIETIIDLLRQERYRWTPMRRVYIDKQRSTKKRPLGIPMCRSHCTSMQEAWGWCRE